MEQQAKDNFQIVQDINDYIKEDATRYENIVED